MTASTPVWFITGCSTGFGRELARHVLAKGYRVVVTARKIEQVSDIVQGFEANSLVLPLDVTVPAQIAAATQKAEAHFGHIDVLVNNAGVGYFGSLEESGLDEVRHMFEINVWGLVNMTRAVLPGMRARKHGHIVNISSQGGIIAFPSLSFYHGTKFAVEGISESLSHEVEPLGIKVLLVEPSGFRTDWAGRSANEAPRTIDDYAPTAHARINMSRSRSGKQPGDPVRAAEAIVQAVEAKDPPLRLLLGKAAMNGGRTKIQMLQKDFEAWSAVTEGADYPDAS